MSIWGIDFETRSRADIKKTGAFRYAADESTEILLLAISKDDGEPLLWDRYGEDNAPAMALISEMVADDGIIRAFNYKFELAVCLYLWTKTFELPMFDPMRFRCTMVLANMAAIPGSLGNCADYLRMGEGKDKLGKRLIQIFSIPDKKTGNFISPLEDRIVTLTGDKVPVMGAWKHFGEYCRQDVRIERQIAKRLSGVFRLEGDTLDAFLLDIDMCMSGVPVNLPAVEVAETILEEAYGGISVRFRELTGLTPAQNKKLMVWLKERGYPGENLQAGTISTILTGEVLDEAGEETGDTVDTVPLTAEVTETLQMLTKLSFAAPKKILKMKHVACPDGRIRGMINFWGAQRTGRSSSSFVQLQNLKKATSLGSEGAYRLICDGASSDELGMLYGPAVEVLANCVRHFVDPGKGNKLISCDLSQIESRVLAWLAGHEVKLQAFRDKLDLYKVAVGLLYGIPYDQVDKPMRQIGKVCELSLGFEGGVKALMRSAKQNRVDLEEEKAEEIVKTWRQTNEPIRAFWKLCQEAAIRAIKTPEKWQTINDKTKLVVTSKPGFRTMLVRLPSGRYLSYPEPQIRDVFKRKNAETDKWENITESRALDYEGNRIPGVWQLTEISYYGKLDGKSAWGRITTYGGSIAQNITQATAGCLMWYGGVQARKEGFKCLFPVHDESVSEYHPELGQTEDKMAECMERLPAWAEGIPMGTSAGVYEFYTKD